MIKTVKKEIPLPFEEGKTYKTTWAKPDLPELFKIVSILRNRHGIITTFKGIYENSQHLGICPLNGNLLVPDCTFEDEQVEFWDCCEKVKKCPKCQDI